MKIMDSIKEKARNAKTRIYWGAKDAIRWCEENPMLVLAFISGGASIIGSAAKVTSKAIDCHKANIEKTNQNRIYDHETNCYYELKNGPIKANDAIALAELRRHGMSKAEALVELNLIK